MDQSFSEKSTEIVASSAPAAKPKSDPLIGTTVADRYELKSLLGRGATTSVYKAMDREKNRLVAVKILRGDSIFNEQLIQRFKQECETLGLLKHKNIVDLYDSGVNDIDQPYLVMEFVDGISLKQLIENETDADVARVLRIFIQICAALSAAHEKGVVHRDMKPANIMLTHAADGSELVKILDFGVAKLLVQGETFQTKTQTGEMLGTLLYMSPEQCLEQVLDSRCDVYSVGCVLFETLTGKPPLVGRTAFETMNKHLTEMPEKLSRVRPDRQFDKRLDKLLKIAMAKNPNDRYQTIGALQDALSAVLSNLDSQSSEEVEEDLVPASQTSAQLETIAPASVPEPNIADHSSSSLTPANIALLLCLVVALLFMIIAPQVWILFPILLICLAVNVTYNSMPKPAETARLAYENDTSEDTSRDGGIYFLAMEAMDGINWKTIYADRMRENNITEADVEDQIMRLVTAQENALRNIEDFATTSFDELDVDSDGFITKQELLHARSSTDLRFREHAYLSFLLQHVDDIAAGDADGALDAKGISQTNLSKYFRTLKESTKQRQFVDSGDWTGYP